MKRKKELIKILKPYKKRFGYEQKEVWDKIALSYMKKCIKILDIACGEGRFIENDRKRIIGVDYNNNSLKICKQKKLNVKYSKATALNFKNNTFDAVHCSHLIEHLIPKDAHKLLVEMDRVLKLNGIMCIRTPFLHKTFYNDLTHIKPYNPKAILHYLQDNKVNQRTLGEINSEYKVIKLKIRKRELGTWLAETPFWLLTGFCNILNKFGITSLEKTGYMLVLKKVKDNK